MKILDSFTKDLKKYVSKNKFDKYETIADAKEYFKFNIINVPSNGLCLLYSFQTVFLVDYDRFYKLETIKKRILDEFKNFISFENLSVFLSNEDSNQFKTNSKIIISSLWHDPIQNSLQINIFNLINYLEAGVFNAGIVDIIPRLLAYGFECVINVYEFANGYLLFKEKFSPRTFKEQMRVDNSLDTAEDILPTISFLFLQEKMHYVALTRAKASDNKMELMREEKSNSILSLITTDEFYSNIAKNYQAKSQYLISNSLFLTQDKILLQSNLEPKFRIAKIESLDLKGIKFLPLKNEKKFPEDFQKSIQKNSCDLLIHQFLTRFQSQKDLIYFLNNEEIYPTEAVLLKHILTYAHVICVDLNAESHLKCLSDFLAFVFVLGSLKGLYSEIELIWSYDLKTLKSLTIRPRGVKINCQLIKFEVLMLYDEQTNAICFSVLQNFEKFLPIKNINSDKKRIELIKQINNITMTNNDLSKHSRKKSVQSLNNKSVSKNVSSHKLDTKCLSGDFIDNLPIFNITILFIAVTLIVIFICLIIE